MDTALNNRVAQVQAQCEEGRAQEEKKPLLCQREGCGKEIPESELPDSARRMWGTGGKPPSWMVCRACRDADIERRKQDKKRQRKQEQEARQRAAEAWRKDLHQHLAEYLVACGIPPIFAAASFDNCPDLPPQLVADAKAWAEHPQGFLFFHGVPGSGKSWLSAAVVRHALLRLEYVGCRGPGQRIRYLSEGNYLGGLKAGYDAGQSDGLPTDRLPENHPRKVRLLAYDDLADRRLTDWVKDRVAYLIEGRYADCLPTVITSNLTLDELARGVDARISSRIQHYDRICQFPSKDLRKEGSLPAVS